MKGFTLEGFNFYTSKELIIGKDVWFVGHCIISPIKAMDKSMAMVGSVVTKDMDYNTIYAGVPAKEISSKIGPQFRDVSIKEKIDKMKGYLKQIVVNNSKLKIVETIEEFKDDGCTYFAVNERVYTKRGTRDEINFMNFLLPDKTKFTPYSGK